MSAAPRRSALYPPPRADYSPGDPPYRRPGSADPRTTPARVCADPSALIAKAAPLHIERLRIGTRGSPLALAQAHQVAALLARHAAARVGGTEILVIKTTGDQVLDRPLAAIGGKGLFTKEIEEALIDGRIDIAVHSAKDMPTVLPDGLVLAGYLAREDVRDVFISRVADAVEALPRGAKVGTASLRRQALIRRLRPDLAVEVFRGNVQTRLSKLDAGVVDATLLALAGLKRLGLPGIATAILDVETFPPALGQGAIAIETRAGEAPVAAALAPILDAETGIALAAERGFLGALDGSCRTPIAGLATVAGGLVSLHGLVATPDGRRVEETRVEAGVTEAAALGRAAGLEMKGRLGPEFFADWGG